MHRQAEQSDATTYGFPKLVEGRLSCIYKPLTASAPGDSAFASLNLPAFSPCQLYQHFRLDDCYMFVKLLHLRTIISLLLSKTVASGLDIRLCEAATRRKRWTGNVQYKFRLDYYPLHLAWSCLLPYGCGVLR